MRASAEQSTSVRVNTTGGTKINASACLRMSAKKRKRYAPKLSGTQLLASVCNRARVKARCAPRESSGTPNPANVAVKIGEVTHATAKAMNGIRTCANAY